MPRLKTLFATVLLCCLISPAYAVLKAGADAPNFSIDAVLGGKPFHFSLTDALKNGPVVLYFYPKAFTGGCTVEAHLFSDAADTFGILHATVIGISSDTDDAVQRFSVEECHSKFAIAADTDGKVIELYDAQLLPVGHRASRTTYVITPDRKIYYVYKALNPDDHVKNAKSAIARWMAAKQNH